MDKGFPLRRRQFLAASSASLLECARNLTVAAFSPQLITLSDEHHSAVNRRRRIVVQYDAWSQLGIDFDQWIRFRFDYADENGSQIDSLWWDITECGSATYPSKLLQFVPQPGLEKWRRQGIDWIERLVAETRRRGLEVFWNHRISEVELDEAGVGAGWNGEPHPIKKEHPDWVIKTWWKQGLWNLAVPAVREHKVSVLRELLTPTLLLA